MSHSSLDAVIAAYALAVEAGDVPNRQELLDHHPEHADALLAFFADFDRMDRIASPLRLAGGMDATNAVEADGHTALPTVRYFGDYELQEEIARGGMGVVYKARQVSLNRLVALKMILRGTFASHEDVTRFRAEAESAANLDHPNIVPIYEVGAHEGQQYYSMKFVEGTSLAKHPRLDPRREVEGMIAVIRAVHHAHQRGVLHRDLKPSNVLVDSNGTRLVTDFGLAKRLADTDRSLTGPGAVLSTPRYMAPEQAAGRKDLTVAADEYSLGVILYERLTGQTPFTGENVLSILRQARESEPPRPSSIRPGIDRDLETVVLKCLDKDPSRRYSSAEALADDLANWLAGRPITARPVGQGERLWRWCKRNRAVASLAVSVALALVLGVVVSTYFAIKANTRARAERQERIRAENAERDAIAARDGTERTFAQSLARPLDPNGDEGGHEALSEPETLTLWELSLHQGKPLGFRFLDEATRDPVTARQLRARSEPALITAVGLDSGKRERASGLLAERLRDPGLPFRSKAEVALVSLEIEDRVPAIEEYTGIIVRALARDFPETLRSSWRKHLIEASSRLDASLAARVLVATLERETDANARSEVASALATAVGLLEPADGARVSSAVLEREPDADALEMVTSMMGRVRGMGMMMRGTAGSALGNGLAMAVGRMDKVAATRIYGQASRVLAAALERETDADVRSSLVSELASVAGHLERTEATRIYGQAARVLAAALERETDANARSTLASGLASMAGRMEPAEVARILGEALNSEKLEPGAIQTLSGPFHK